MICISGVYGHANFSAGVIHREGRRQVVFIKKRAAHTVGKRKLEGLIINIFNKYYLLSSLDDIRSRKQVLEGKLCVRS